TAGIALVVAPAAWPAPAAAPDSPTAADTPPAPVREADTARVQSHGPGIVARQRPPMSPRAPAVRQLIGPAMLQIMRLYWFASDLLATNGIWSGCTCASVQLNQPTWPSANK